MYKLTDSDIEKLTFNEIYQKMDSQTQTIMHGHMCDAEYSLLLTLQDCESPIERMMAYAIDNANLHQMHLFNPDIELDNYEKQANIICGKNHYRADFLIEINYHKLNCRKSFVIECDGHDFHEKTKEQVIKDNRRDRDMSNYGYVVLRFSGSEIFKKHPYECVNEIINSILFHSKSR